MTIADRRGVQRVVPVFLSYGFRPFFLMGALWSAAALLVWIVLFVVGGSLPSRFDPLGWHIHEMLFGFVMATIAGFLLTAMANWTGRQPVNGALLALLTTVWLFGRLVCLISAFLPSWLAAIGDLAFPALLAGVIAREIIAGRNWRNLPMIGAVTVLGIANSLMHLESAGVSVPPGLGWRLGLAAVIVLISVVGGRIVPSFTRNWLAKRQTQNLPGPPGIIDRAALGTLHAGLFGWAFAPDFPPLGLLLMVSAALSLWRLIRWRGVATAAEPLLLVLHVGYAWMVLGAALLGLSMVYADVPLTAAVHALTAGAIGTMTLAVMRRATRGHTGRELSALRPSGRCRCWSARRAYGLPPSRVSYCFTRRCCSGQAIRVRGAGCAGYERRPASSIEHPGSKQASQSSVRECLQRGRKSHSQSEG